MLTGASQSYSIPMTASQMRLLKSGAVPARRSPAADGPLDEGGAPSSGEEGAVAEEVLDPSSGLSMPYIDLLYFTNASALPEDMQLKESLFLFPDDTTITGSTCAFRSLLKQMSAKGVIGVGRMLRGVSEQRLVALLPLAETIDSDGYLERAGGMEVIYLPFTQEIRAGTASAASFAEDVDSSSALAAAEDLVKSLKFGPSFRYTDLESPGLQYFYANLQAIALAEDRCDWDAARDDMLLPDKDSFAAHEDKLLAFMATAGLPSCSDGSDVVKATVSTISNYEVYVFYRCAYHFTFKQSRKRASASSSDGAPPAKASKAAGEAASLDDEGGITMQQVKDAVNSDTVIYPLNIFCVLRLKHISHDLYVSFYLQLMSFTLSDLKDVCKMLGVPVTGTKAVLVGRVTAKVAASS